MANVILSSSSCLPHAAKCLVNPFTAHCVYTEYDLISSNVIKTMNSNCCFATILSLFNKNTFQ